MGSYRADLLGGAVIQRIWAAVLFFTGLVIFTAAVIIAYSPEAKASVSNPCIVHLAEHPGTTAAADRRYHLEHGEFSPCTEQDTQQERQDDSSAHRDSGNEHSDNSDSGDDGRKSHYCRKHWYC